MGATYAAQMEVKPLPVSLTAREIEVLKLMADGKSTKEMGAILRVNIRTIESHRRNLMHKLDIFHIAGLTKFAIRNGLSTLD